MRGGGGGVQTVRLGQIKFYECRMLHAPSQALRLISRSPEYCASLPAPGLQQEERGEQKCEQDYGCGLQLHVRIANKADVLVCSPSSRWGVRAMDRPMSTACARERGGGVEQQELGGLAVHAPPQSVQPLTFWKHHCMP